MFLEVLSLKAARNHKANLLYYRLFNPWCLPVWCMCCGAVGVEPPLTGLLIVSYSGGTSPRHLPLLTNLHTPFMLNATVKIDRGVYGKDKLSIHQAVLYK